MNPPTHSHAHDLELIRRALHRGRASVFVGAGFSMNARPRSPSSRSFPLWPELTAGLAQELYPTDVARRDEVIRSAGTSSGALRLAELYEVAFGANRLKELLRRMLPDDDHDPGPLHRQLLELPWADVFTTNYDTLLERQARGLLQRKYDIVRSVSELPLASRPRIVKLHGTLPELRDLILTEEDYRSYPERHAPLVHEIRVAMIETTLCLIGFSGDDPNFLNWTGWVRDQMGESRPFIYFFTSSDLAPFQRRLLEDRRIIPIPIFEVTDETDHQLALKRLLVDLSTPPSETRQPRWGMPSRTTATQTPLDEPTAPQTPTRSDWLRTAQTWRDHRRSHLGWAVLPRRGLELIWPVTERWLIQTPTSAIGEFDAPTAIFVLREIAWRFQASLLPLWDDLVFKEIDRALSAITDWKVSHNGPNRDSILLEDGANSFNVSLAELFDAELQLRLETLRHAREIGNATRFQEILSVIESQLGQTDAMEQAIAGKRDEARQFVTHQRCLQSLSRLQHGTIRHELLSWDVDGVDDIWSIRKAALLLEATDLEAARTLLEATLTRLRTNRTQHDTDYHQLSREGWAVYLLGMLDQREQINQGYHSHAVPAVEEMGQESDNTTISWQERLNQLRDVDCDPRDVIDWIELENAVGFEPPRPTTIQHAFDPRQLHRNIHFSDSGYSDRARSAYRAIRLIEDGALPLRIGNMIVTEKLYRQATTEYLVKAAPTEATGVVLRSRDPKQIESFFTRPRIALYLDEQVRSLHQLAWKALHDALDEFSLNPASRESNEEALIGLFASAIELLSRVSIRLNDAELEQMLPEVLTLPSHPKLRTRWQLGDRIARLVQRVCTTLSDEARNRHLVAFLQTPLPGTADLPIPINPSYWFDPLVSLRGWHENSLAKSSEAVTAIETLIETVARSLTPEARRYATVRLITLRHVGLLADDHARTFAKALFAAVDDQFGFPKETSCFDSVILLLPKVSEQNERDLFRPKYTSTVNSATLPDSYFETINRSDRLVAPDGTIIRRGIQWTIRDLTAFVQNSAQYFGKVGSELQTRRANPSPMAVALGFGGTSERQSVRQANHVLAHIVLQSPKSTAKLAARVREVTEVARSQMLPVLSIYPALLRWFPELDQELTRHVREQLFAEDEDDRIDALNAVAHWGELQSKLTIPRIPEDILVSLATLIAACPTDGLGQLLGVASTLTRNLNEAERNRIAPTLCRGLERLFDLLPYTLERKVFAPEEIPDLRAGCAGLASRLHDVGITHAAVERWIAAAASDPLPEVRKALLTVADDV